MSPSPVRSQLACTPVALASRVMETPSGTCSPFSQRCSVLVTMPALSASVVWSSCLFSRASRSRSPIEFFIRWSRDIFVNFVLDRTT